MNCEQQRGDGVRSVIRFFISHSHSLKCYFKLQKYEYELTAVDKIAFNWMRIYFFCGSVDGYFSNENKLFIFAWRLNGKSILVFVVHRYLAIFTEIWFISLSFSFFLIQLAETKFENLWPTARACHHKLLLYIVRFSAKWLHVCERLCSYLVSCIQLSADVNMFKYRIEAADHTNVSYSIVLIYRFQSCYMHSL